MTDDLTEKDLTKSERAALRLARLPEARLRALPIPALRQAYDAATGIDTAEFLSDEDRERVLKISDERHVTRIDRPKKKRRDGLLKFHGGR